MTAVRHVLIAGLWLAAATHPLAAQLVDGKVIGNLHKVRQTGLVNASGHRLTGATAGQFAIGFHTGATAFDFGFFSARLFRNSSNEVAAPSVSGGIYSSASFTNPFSTWFFPNAQLAQFDAHSVGNMLQFPNNVGREYTFKIADGSGFTFQANSTYWIVLNKTSGLDDILWLVNARATDQPDFPNASPDILPGSGLRWISGSQRSTNQQWPMPWAPVEQGLFALTASPATVVPEPSTYALLGTGLLVLGLVRRRRA
ncbi:MAG: PEP-CTERM sorting domain-containing protein [Gemmatimonadaceae bacterium]|jgi:hypothetical protein|nr:PEP-CTERM sorting domain-containing protein [Gemmatimonadaceae bacterium]